MSAESYMGDQTMVGISTLSWRRVLLVSAAVGTAMFLSPGAQRPAMAQQVSGAMIEEITVTVRRREETIKDVPATLPT